MMLAATISSPSRSISQHHQRDRQGAPTWIIGAFCFEHSQETPVHLFCRLTWIDPRCLATHRDFSRAYCAAGQRALWRDDMEFPEPGIPPQSFSTDRCALFFVATRRGLPMSAQRLSPDPATCRSLRPRRRHEHTHRSRWSFYGQQVSTSAHGRPPLSMKWSRCSRHRNMSNERHF